MLVSAFAETIGTVSSGNVQGHADTIMVPGGATTSMQGNSWSFSRGVQKHESKYAVIQYVRDEQSLAAPAPPASIAPSDVPPTAPEPAGQ